jgi:ferric-dicitrate binding protein FerR (iron transport regulator)
MERIFQSVEEILTDELFQAWYFKTDPEKFQQWQEWLSQNPGQQEMVNAATACMQDIVIHEREIPAATVSAARERLMASLQSTQAPVVQMGTRRRKWGWTAAAAVILIAAGAYLWTSLGNQSSIKTAYGQVSTQQLPDGSEVILNANSSVSYSEGWEKGKEREVWVKGEAFFKVKKTPNKSRFIVHTNQLDVVVTGTQFNVVSRSQKSSVMLTEGSVIIRTKDGSETKMVPGEFVELSDKQLEKKAVKEETVLAWKEKKILFNDTPLTEVIAKIKEHYGEEVVIEDEQLARKTVTGMMPNDNLDVLLKSLEATLEATVVRKDGRIMITHPQ